MASGLGVTFYYMLANQPWLRATFGITSPIQLCDPISAGLFGVSVGFAGIILVSLVTPPSRQNAQNLVECIPYPDLKSL